MTGDGTRTCEWDGVNQLAAVNIGMHRSEFTYDGASRRTRMVEKDSGVVTRDARLIWAGTEIIEERLSTGEVSRFFADSEQCNSVAKYITRDHLGSVREATDSSGAIVTRNDYDPYGRLTRIGGTEDSRLSYTGHYSHLVTGLVLAPYRSYHPDIGRWLSQDPAKMIDGPNMLSYAGQNPIRFRDPLGLEWSWQGAASGFASGAMEGAAGALAGGIVIALVTGGTATPGIVMAGMLMGGISGALAGGLNPNSSAATVGAGALGGAIGGVVGGRAAVIGGGRRRRPRRCAREF